MNTSVDTTTGNESEKKESESAFKGALIASEAQYRRLFETAKDGILILDAESGKIIDVNPFLVDLLGYSKENFIDKELWEIGFFKDIAANKEKFHELQRKKYVRYDDLPLETTDGRKINVEFVSNVYWVKKKKVIQCNIRDITKRKQAERSLLESEKKFKSYIDFAPDGIFVVDESGSYVDINNSACKMTGYSKNELMKMSIADLLAKESSEEGLTHFKNLIEKGSSKGDLSYKQKDGSCKWWSLNAVKLSEKRFLGFAKDITERKLAEEEIAILSQSLKSINECVSITDLNDDILFVNESFLKTYGYDKKELIGKNITIIRSKKNELELVEEILPATISGEWQGELLNRRKDGSEIPIYLSTSVIRDKESKVLGLIGVATDITERKNTEELLVKLSTAIEQTIDAIVITDRDGIIEYVNPSFEDLTGYSSEEVLGKTPRILKSDTRDQKYYEELWKTILAGKVFRAEVVNKKKNGDLYDEEKTISPIFDKNKNITHFIGTGIDITERKKLESEKELDHQVQEALNKILSISVENISLEESLERILITIISLPFLSLEKRGGVLLTEEGTNILTLKTSFNLSTEIKTLCSRVPFGHCLCGRAAATREIQYAECIDEEHEISYKGIKPHGHYNVPILTSDNVLGVIVVYLAEHHKQKEYEHDFLLAAAVILSGLIQRKRAEKELIASKEKAEESDRLKSSFLANMSHEFRTPLNSIIGFSELLADSFFNEDQKKEFIEHIITNGNSLLSIISDIMDISKLESGDCKIHKSQINVQQFISNIKKQFTIQVEGKKLELKLSIPKNGEETTIFADTDRLKQIFNNLISNAIKFTANGRIEIGYTLKSVTPTMVNKVNMVREPVELEFFVKDTGIGIPAKYHDKIFERFMQVETTFTREFGGVGLGLPISKNLVELMGGKIWFESEINKGSKFYFTVPIYSETIK